MLLAVDVGNSQTVIGVFNGEHLANHWRLSTDPERTPDELALMFGGLMAFEDLSFSRNVHGVIVVVGGAGRHRDAARHDAQVLPLRAGHRRAGHAHRHGTGRRQPP